MFKRIAAAVGVALTPLAFAAPAFAWHVVSADAECVEGYVTAITIDLSDQGAGTYSDDLGNSGSFTSEPFTYNAGETDAGTVVVTIVQVGAEGDQVVEVEVDECKPPTTTTTIPTTSTTTTTVAPTSTTTPSDTTTIPAPPTTAPTTAAPGAELPKTGGPDSTFLFGIAGWALILGCVAIVAAFDLGRRGQA